ARGGSGGAGRRRPGAWSSRRNGRRGWSSSCRGGPLPLAPENRVDQLIGPLALDEFVLDQVRLTAHAVALHDPGRRPVAAVAPADDPVQAQALEPEPEQGRRRLGGEPPALEGGVEDEPDLALLVGLAQPEQGAAANELPGLGPLGGHPARPAA